jgi:DNA repair exonuclease SbcCD ATPase subunit
MFLIKKVRLKNFRSYGNQFTEIDLTRSKTTVITAPNGSGKSTILYAIEFGLFGRVSGGINKNDLVNSINRKDMVVEIECETKGKKIKVTRGVKPHVFEIEIDGELVNQSSSIKDYQNYFEEEVLGFNLNSFRQVVSISGGSYTPFLLLTAGARRKIVEELLDLTIFSKMHMLHLSQTSALQKEIADLETEIAKRKASILSLKKGLDKILVKESGIRESVIAKIEETQGKIEQLQEEIAKLNEDRSILEKRSSELKGQVDKLRKLQTYKQDIIGKMTRIEKFLGFMNENDVCPTCSQQISEEFKTASTSERTRKKEELKSSFDKLMDVMSQCEKNVSLREEFIERIRSIENDLNLKTKRVSDFQKYIKEQQDFLNETVKEDVDLREQIKAEVKDLEELSKKRLDLLEQKQYNDVVSAVIKDNGIKARIISQFIPMLIKNINKYLQILDLGISFEMDETFNERILSRFKDELSYSSFSAGERARIDIAILFTWREIAASKNSLRCNLLFLDEIFDAVLDEPGLESFINLLAYHLEDTNVFLISHRPEVVDKFESNLRIVKKGNFSKIE